MSSTQRPNSVRAFGARRLKQATVAMVVAGVGGAAGLAVHDSQAAHDSTSTATMQTSSTTSSSSTVTATQSAPQATSGGS